MKPTEFTIKENVASRQLHRGRLFRKYFVLILLLVCGTLVVSGGIGLYFAYQENKAALASLQREKASSAAARIEEYIRQIEVQLEFAALPQLGGLEQRLLEFQKVLRVAQAVTDIAYVDDQGREQLYVSRLAMNVLRGGKDRSPEAAFREAKPGETWFGPVYFRKDTEPYMRMAVRTRERGPVTVADVNLKFIWDVVTRIRVGDKGRAYVVDGTGHLVAHPDIGLVLRKTRLSHLEQVKQALAPGAPDAEALLATDVSGGKVLTAFTRIEYLRWIVFVEQPEAEVYAALDATILRTVAFLVAGLLFSALAALWLARSMARPISILQDGAARIGAGDLDQAIEVRTGDELESLADEFNRMSAQLRESYAGLEKKVEERTGQLTEALEQQTAISEILRVISSSPSDVRPVLEAVIERAARICDANIGDIVIVEGGMLKPVAMIGTLGRPSETPLDRGTVMGRSIVERKTIHVADLHAEAAEYPRGQALAKKYGHRTILAVPLLRENRALGTILLRRAEVRPFEDKHIALLQTFADQAAIAIENVRLFNETKEALEQQTATSEILKVISRTTFDLQPVLEIVLSSARKLCEADRGFIFRPNEHGEYVPMAVVTGDASESGLRAVIDRAPIRLDRASATGRAVLEGVTVHIPDVRADAKYDRRDIAEAGNYRTLLAVPMLRSGESIGVLTLSRQGEPRPFTDKQIDLVRVFADQAVIAIENVRLFNEIQDKSRQLEIANKHKSDFLANMSHELRTPLNAIIGFSEVLSDRMFGELNEKQADYLKDIHESGKHLLSLINDILDLSKIEAGRMDLEIGVFDLPAALSNAMTLVRERAQRHGIGLGLEVDKRLGEFRADERKFKQIVLNLLSNAVKFTPDGGRVDVSATQGNEKIEIAVRDTGIGIAPEDQAAVFEEFKQVGRDARRKSEGTGLGLALTKRFVELHGGDIRLESIPGKGSTFTITLPLNLPPRGA